MPRSAHLIGSIPAPDAEAAMRQALEALGPNVRYLPDGETGERHHWVIDIVEGFREHPDLELVADRRWSGYDDLPKFRIRRGRRLFGATLDFGHVAAFRTSWPVFQRLRQEAGRPNVAFQVGVPGDFDMAMFRLGPAGRCVTDGRSPRPPSGISTDPRRWRRRRRVPDRGPPAELVHLPFAAALCGSA